MPGYYIKCIHESMYPYKLWDFFIQIKGNDTSIKQSTYQAWKDFTEYAKRQMIKMESEICKLSLYAFGAGCICKAFNRIILHFTGNELSIT